MSRRFLVDANLPIALARMLTDLGYPSTHLADISLADAADERVWQTARDRGETIISKDVDFARRIRESASGPAVVWVRIGNVRRDELLARMRQEIGSVTTLLNEGERLIEVR